MKLSQRERAKWGQGKSGQSRCPLNCLWMPWGSRLLLWRLLELFPRPKTPIPRTVAAGSPEALIWEQVLRLGVIL